LIANITKKRKRGAGAGRFYAGAGPHVVAGPCEGGWAVRGGPCKGGRRERTEERGIGVWCGGDVGPWEVSRRGQGGRRSGDRTVEQGQDGGAGAGRRSGRKLR